MVDKQRTLPELLAPAGDMERLKMAVLYGADAVYLAGTDFGMRAFAGNFDPDELKAAVAYAHAHNVRVHCTINTMPRGDEIVRLPAHLERLNDAGVDAVIVADLGAFTLAGKYAPNCQRHISTQASISNYVTANAWYDLGASRVILARELSLDEIREIRRRVDDALAAVDMTAFMTHAPHLLSGGQKQRIAIAGVIAMEPECIVLDEATAMLDPIGRQEVLSAVHKLNREKGITVVLITHHMNEAEEADRVIVMDDGRIALDGTPKEVFTQVEPLRTMGLTVPDTVDLLDRLRKDGLDVPLDALTVDECAAAITAALAKN